MNIGRYEIIDEIGRGAMGTVYRAHDPLIDRTVAIKTVSIAQLRQEGPDAEARFLREAQSAGRLSHPNIMTIYDVGETDGLAYIAMEYLAGATLRDLMNKGPMPVDLALETATQMAEALAFAHEHGVIHRDIKPANVVVTGRRGRIKLTDFGIAHLTNSDHTHTGQMLGSPRYMAPEQAMGQEVDGRSDIFSLGAMLYEMLTGHYAFDGDSLPTIVYRVVNEQPVSAAALRPELPAGLVSLLTHMLSKNPQARPDARTVVHALHSLAPARGPFTTLTNRVPRILAVMAFGAPVGVFLMLGVGMIVIQHFLHAAADNEANDSQLMTVPEPPPAADEEPVADAPAASESPPAAPRPAQTGPNDPYLAELERKQVQLRIRRTELLLKYTALHPDVVEVERQLQQLRDERRAYLRQKEKERRS